MRLRSVHIRDHDKLGSFEVDLRQGTGEIPRLFGIWGNNGVGKSLVLGLARCAWLSCVTGQTFPGAFGKCEAQVNFEQDGEVFAIRYAGQMYGVPGVAAAAQAGDRKNLMLWYGPERLWNASGESLGVRTAALLLSDLRATPAATGCVALIDDFDLGLDVTAQEKLLGMLMEHHSRLGNQLVITSRGYMPWLGRTQRLGPDVCSTEWLVALNGKTGH